MVKEEEYVCSLNEQTKQCLSFYFELFQPVVQELLLSTSKKILVPRIDYMARLLFIFCQVNRD